MVILLTLSRRIFGFASVVHASSNFCSCTTCRGLAPLQLPANVFEGGICIYPLYLCSRTRDESTASAEADLQIGHRPSPAELTPCSPPVNPRWPQRWRGARRRRRENITKDLLSQENTPRAPGRRGAPPEAIWEPRGPAPRPTPWWGTRGRPLFWRAR